MTLTPEMPREEWEAMKRDAERYRWLRHGDNDEVVLRVTDDTAYLPRNEELDAAIDAAIKGERG